MSILTSCRICAICPTLLMVLRMRAGKILGYATDNKMPERACKITCESGALVSVVAVHPEISLAAFGLAVSSCIVGVVDDLCSF